MEAKGEAKAYTFKLVRNLWSSIEFKRSRLQPLPTSDAVSVIRAKVARHFGLDEKRTELFYVEEASGQYALHEVQNVRSG